MHTHHAHAEDAEPLSPPLEEARAIETARVSVARSRPFVHPIGHGVNEYWMSRALAQADLAADAGEVPVGCVIVDAAGRAVGAAHNARETLADPTAHAEMIAIREAAAKLLGWRLEGATAYVTLEPCAMCAGALVLARVARVVYGCPDPKSGAIDTMFGIGRDARLNHRFDVVPGILADDCAQRLRRFFGTLRGAAPPAIPE